MKQTDRLLDAMLWEYFQFLEERHAIFIRRERGDPRPWTEDTILNTYKFTNIFRELDRGTVWCREHIREPYAKHPELFFNIATYRRYNYWPTQQELGFITDYMPQYYTDMMLDRKARGDQVFTGAHMLCGNICWPGTKKHPKDKVIQIFNISFSQLWEKRKEVEPQPGDTLEIAFNRLLGAKLPGFGSFICYEIITDLRWTRYLNQAPDIMTWANPGPGCKRGIIRMMGLPVWNYVGNGGIDAQTRALYPKNSDWLPIMRYILAMAPVNLPKWFPRLELRDVEHSLCEFDKYMRAKTGEGRPRSKFVPYKEDNPGQRMYVSGK